MGLSPTGVGSMLTRQTDLFLETGSVFQPLCHVSGVCRLSPSSPRGHTHA